eukprot:jgi/Ulvmu1/2237/UM013_0084.1
MISAPCMARPRHGQGLPRWSSLLCITALTCCGNNRYSGIKPWLVATVIGHSARRSGGLCRQPLHHGELHACSTIVAEEHPCPTLQGRHLGAAMLCGAMPQPMVATASRISHPAHRNPHTATRNSSARAFAGAGADVAAGKT